MTRLYPLQNFFNVLCWVLDVLNTNTTAEQEVLIGIVLVRWDDTRTVDHVNALHQSDVLPDLGLTSDGRNNAHLLFPQSVDDGRFTSVGITDHAHGDLFTIAVERAELSEKGNQGTFTEAVVDGGVESKCGELLAKVAYPGGLSSVSAWPST